MPDLKEECFCRLQLLSTKGVTPVLVKVLEDIVNKTCNGDLDKFLKVYKKEILKLKIKKIIHEAAYQVLFPKNGKTDIYTWDISLLTCIVFNFCTLEERCNKKTLINLLEQEAANNYTGIQAILANNKVRIDQNVKNQISDIQYDQIFPKSGVTVDIKSWDFDVLLIVLAVCCTGVRSTALKDEGKQLLLANIDLSQYNADLAAFLNSHSKRLNELRQNVTISNQEYELMFPTKAIDPDINTWDQWLLVIVILNVCPRIKHSSIKAIKSLRSVRNEAIAHASLPEIEENKFRTLWKKIVEAIEIVIENDCQVYTILQWNESVSHIRSGPLNKKESIDILKEWYEDRNETNEKFAQTIEKLTETNEKLTQLQQHVDNLNEAQKHGLKDIHKDIKEIKDVVKQKQVSELNDKVQVVSDKRPDIYKSQVVIPCVDIKIMLQGNDVSAVRRAEDLIRQAFDDEKDVTKKDDAASLTVMKLKEIISIKKEITQEGSVIVGVVKGSIILRMKCHTLMELKYLLLYEGQLEMKMRFDALAEAVGPVVGDTIAINAESGITDYSLIAINTEVTSICLKNDIELPVLVEDETKQLLAENFQFKNDDVVDTADDPSPAAKSIKIKPVRAEKIGTYKGVNNVRSCVVLPTGYIVVCDSMEIKLFDETFTRRDVINLEVESWDSSLSLNETTQVFVTIPDKKSIYNVTVNNKLRTVRQMHLKEECRGITCLVTGIAVTVGSKTRWHIELLQYNGQQLKTIGKDETQQLQLRSPAYITSLNRTACIITSDKRTGFLTSVDVDSKRVKFSYACPSLNVPVNVTSDSEDNIYVAGYRSNTVHVISRTGEKIGDILTETNGLNWPKGLCYNKLNNTLLLQPDYRKSEICVYKIVKNNV